MDLLGFAFAVLLIELTPGPNMGWLVALTLAEGRRAGLAAITGIALGLAANAAISALAASFVLQQSASLAKGVAVFGAGMMTYLAWQAWRDAEEISPAVTPKQSDQRNALSGFAINLLNPKATLFFVAVMPQFVDVSRPTYIQSLTMAALLVAIATAIHLCLVIGAHHLRPVLLSNGRACMVRRVLALGMLGVGAWFLAKAFL